MRKLILFLIVGMVLVSFVGAEDCRVVWPQFGTVKCDVPYGGDTKTESAESSWDEEYYIFSLSCAGKANCKVNPSNIIIKCESSLMSYYYKVIADGIQSIEYSNCWGCDNKFPPSTIEFSDSLIIRGNCRYKLGNENYPFVNSQVTMSYQDKFLYDTNSDRPGGIQIIESIGCIPNDIMVKEGYISKLPSDWIDSQGNSASGGFDKPKETLKDSLPTNMNPGETYSYLYGWREVSGINLVKDKSGDLAGYCGGNLGDRKLLSYEPINEGGNCYIIPTSIEKNVECCYNEDCKWKGEDYVCDPTTFICSENIPCNSDIECQVIGQATCSNKIETSWACNLNKPWHPKSGTCEKSTKNVLCCSNNDCEAGEYCNREEGCKSIYVLEDCPSGKCCFVGGDYKEKGCSGGKECCTYGGYIGECKESCEEIDGGSSSPITGEVIGEGKSSSTGLIILIIFLILIGGSIGFYFYNKNKKTTPLKPKPKPEPKEEPKKEVVEIPKGKHCAKCGAPLREKVRFCGGCGVRVRR